MDTEFAIALENVIKRHGSGPQAITAVSELSLRVPDGQFVAITGPSGSGKSTLLNLIAGLERPSSGRVLVANRDLTRLSDDERSRLRLEHIGFVFQSFNLLPTFTAEENVAWPLEFLGITWRDARRRAADALDRVGLEAARRRRPAELSGGEQQRVAIARALVTEPWLLLADEPTGNLDSGTGEAVLALLQALNVERRATIVMVTHSAVAAAYAQRIVELRDGRVVGDATASHADARPRRASGGNR
jgi:putative ABC transport system ATP-binding protein